jgi:curved DNA-binding protein CbpA
LIVDSSIQLEKTGMAETFYTALEVGDDADAEAIRRAYREQVKRYHPDVSDEPGAPREFNRLTTARDVLVDETERDRYDRLGHATYVRRHLDSSAWGGATQSGTGAGQTGTGGTGTDGTAHGGSAAGPTAGGSRTASAESGSAGNRQRHRATGTQDYDRSAWLGDDWERSATGRDRHHASAPHGAATSSRTAGDAPWQHASEAYRYEPSTVPSDPRTVWSSARQILTSVGPWLLVHLVFVLGALGTAWYLFTNTALVGGAVLPAMAFGVLLVGLTLLLSALHLVSLVVG